MTERTARITSPVGPRARVDGREVDYFCGTSYFSLHSHPDVIAAACEATRLYGVASATALQSPAHVELEDELCQFLGTEAVVHVASGYLAPLALLQGLTGRYDIAFADSAAHYGVFDGLRAVEREAIAFRHLDADDLKHQLRSHVRPGQRPLVLTDGVFPSTGALAPLPQYATLLAEYAGGLLFVDDAHAFGVIGETGNGSLEYHGVERAAAAACGTLSKAFGGGGGFVPGDRALRAAIEKHSRVPLGASAPSVPIAAASAAGARILREHPEMRAQLWANARFAREELRSLGFDLEMSPIPIVSLAGRPGVDLRRVHAALAADGIAVLYVPPRGYSDAPDVESLRIAIFSTHTRDQIARLTDAVRRAL